MPANSISAGELLPNALNKEIWFQELARPYHFEVKLSEPFVLILFVADESISNDERNAISDQIVNTRCKYVVCAGHDCSEWDDSVDWSDMAKWNYDVPYDEHIMTTWHTDQTVEEVIDFGLISTEYDDHKFQKYVIVQLGQNDSMKKEIVKTVAEKRR